MLNPMVITKCIPRDALTCRTLKTEYFLVTLIHAVQRYERQRRTILVRTVAFSAHGLVIRAKVDLYTKLTGKNIKGANSGLVESNFK